MILADRTNPCPRHLGNNPAGLACTSAEGHPYGCVFIASAGVMDAEASDAEA